MSFHQYRINELYSNASGSIQFIEMRVGNFSGESQWSGVTLTSTANGVQRSFSFPSNLPSGNHLRLERVRLYETPNCWADAHRDDLS